MGREVRSRFPQPVPDRSPPTLLRPLCLVWGGKALCRGVTPSSTGFWLPSPLHLAAYTRAELCSPIRNICSPEGRTVTPRLGCQNQPPPTALHPSWDGQQLCSLSMGQQQPLALGIHRGSSPSSLLQPPWG